MTNAADDIFDVGQFRQRSWTLASCPFMASNFNADLRVIWKIIYL